MSVVFVVVPVLVGGWPVLTASILAGSAALGYRAIQETAVASTQRRQRRREEALAAGVSMVMEEGGALSDTLGRGESFAVERDGIRATFARDGRGRLTVHVAGEGRAHAELEAAGRELMDRVRQQFAYAKVMEELEARGFDVVEEAVEAGQTIRIRVRRWS